MPKPAICSYTWRGILNTRGAIERGIRCRVGNGNSIRFWLDWWIGSSRLLDSVIGTLTDHLYSAKVDTFLLPNSHWNFDMFSTYLPHDKVEEIRAVYIPDVRDRNDSSFWGLTSNGKFTTGSAYETLMKDMGVYELHDLKWMWKLPLPARWIFFLWLAWRGKE